MQTRGWLKLAAAFLLILAAAALMLRIWPREEKSVVEYNPVLQVAEFFQALALCKILLIAPSSGVSSERVEAVGAIPGLRLTIPEHLFTTQVPYHSSGDENRFNGLREALQNDAPDTILWSLRGGYGAARLLPELRKIPPPAREKILIGYSDLTALHLFLAQEWGWKTIHGAMLTELLNPGKDPENFLRIADLIAKRLAPDLPIVVEIDGLVPLNEPAKEAAPIEGLLTGGNLTLVQNSIGTDWEIQTRDKIVFFEDNGESGYKIDRYLNHLKQAGLLNSVKAVVFGDFTASDEFMEFALRRFADENAVPMYKSDAFGHGVKNYPLVYNAPATIARNPRAENGGEADEAGGRKDGGNASVEDYRLTLKMP
ncbi:MAG: LD-carboxypeptidase [Planctomycetes bacterium]|nr:LD-carboxypeptidase [Planctomycetota bacterium]